MVKYNRKFYYKKNWGSKKNFNRIASTYMKYKIATNFNCTWAGTSSPYIVWNNPQSGQTLSAETIFGNTGNEYLTLRGYYSYYKITGIAIEVTPIKSLSVNGEFTPAGNVVLSLIQTGETLTYNALSQSPHAMTLDINNKSRKYIPLRGSWVSTNLVADSAIKLCIAANGGIASGSLIFNVKLILYMTFKNPI